MPRVVNLAVAASFLVFLVPLFTHLDDVEPVARVLLLVIAVPFALGTVALLCSAARPGSVGRLLRRGRARR